MAPVVSGRVARWLRGSAHAVMSGKKRCGVIRPGTYGPIGPDYCGREDGHDGLHESGYNSWGDVVPRDISHEWEEIHRERDMLLAEREVWANVAQERNDLRAEVERLTDEHATWRRKVNGLTWAEVIDGLEERATLRAENERLRAALEQIADF